MMLTVQSIPDLKPQRERDNFENVRYIDEEEDKNIPYHARQDSRPFSYGVNSTMITETKGLSSPSLVRKASFNKSSGDTLNKVQTQVYPDFASKPPDFSNNYDPTYNSSSKFNTYSSSLPASTYERRKDPIDDIFTTSALNAQPIRRDFTEAYYKDERKRYDPFKGTLRRSPEKISPYSDSESLSPPGAFRNSTKSPEFHES